LYAQCSGGIHGSSSTSDSVNIHECLSIIDILEIFMSPSAIQDLQHLRTNETHIISWNLQRSGGIRGSFNTSEPMRTTMKSSIFNVLQISMVPPVPENPYNIVTNPLTNDRRCQDVLRAATLQHESYGPDLGGMLATMCAIARWWRTIARHH